MRATSILTAKTVLFFRMVSCVVSLIGFPGSFFFQNSAFADADPFVGVEPYSCQASVLLSTHSSLYDFRVFM